MSAQKKTNKINLLPVDRFAKSTAGRILSWLLSTFRIMVIVVEMVVMAAFLSRFWLDARNSDLNDELKQKRARIEASADLETEYRLIQKKLSIFSALAKTEPPFSQTLKNIGGYLPPDVTLNSISITENQITITGESLSEKSILQTLVNLEVNEDFKNVQLQNLRISEKTENLLSFIINITR